MSNKDVIIITLYARIRHIQFKWRSSQQGWWRTIDPSTILDKTDVKDGNNTPSFMPNKDIIIIILYTRMRHVHFKWRSCRWGWWRTIDPSTLLDNTDMKDGINPPSFMSNKNVIIIREWDMYNLNGVRVGEGGEEQLIPPPSSIKLTWRMVLIHHHSRQIKTSLSLYYIRDENETCTI